MSGKNELSREYLGRKERSNSVCLNPKMEVYKQSLSGEQERWRSQAGNKAQQFEQLSFIPSFKDGTPKRSKVLTATERLHVQNRLCRYADYIICIPTRFSYPVFTLCVSMNYPKT